MNEIKKTTFTVVLVLALAVQAQAQTQATLTDLGGTAPTPGGDDQSQLNFTTDNSQPPSLNYYFNNNPVPGQTFTTGSNANGYVLNTLAVALGNDYGNLPGGGQPYRLNIYSVSSGTNANLVATYVSQNNLIINPPDDWLQWSGLAVAMAPNTKYAYSFATANGGYGLMGNTSGDPYPNGQAVTIPPAGGVITFSSTSGYDAAFDAGLNVAGSLVVNAPTATPANAVTNGTTVTFTTQAAGPGTIGYQWQTDGGSGGTLTNIPAANGPTLTVNTTGYGLGIYQYSVVATNSSSAVTSSVVTLTVYQNASATLTDVGAAITPGSYDISQLNGSGYNTDGGGNDGLNYYDNNNPAPGQTFTTGTNSQGYYLSSVSVGLGMASGNGAAGAGGGYANLQSYSLDIYSVQGGTNATLLANFQSQNFTFNFGDWLTWDGFTPLVLKPNTVYAYSFHRNGSGYAGMSCSPTNTDLYPGGKLCLIPSTGGVITYGASGVSDAAFDLGLLPVGVTAPVTTAISVSPTGPQIPGTTITLSENASGEPPLSYQWQTDGGGGGALTNITSANATNLVLNTTGWQPGSYNYDVVVANTSGSVTSSIASVVITYPNAPAVLSDIGAAAPQPLSAPDLYQPVWTFYGTYGTPPGLSYYINNLPVPGQTFTTGNNPSGYTLSSLALQTGGAGYLPAAGQAYVLRVYRMSSNNATLYASYTSQSSFAFTETNWLRWSGLALPLAPNAVYAYSFGSLNPGNGYYEDIANAPGDNYTGGQTVNIPVAGGPVILPTASGFDATFLLGMALAGHPVVSPPTLSPSNTVYAGSPVTLNASVTGTGPFTYQWQTDNGTGGSFANIPGATNLIQTVSTTGLDGLNVRYALVASNGSGSTTSEASSLTVNPGSGPVLVADVPPALSTFVGGTVTLSASFDGTLPLTYQWQVDKGTGATNIVGQTNSTLVLANLQVGDSGNYTLVASNSLSTANSSTTTLTVWPQLAANTAPFTVNFQFRNNLGGDPGPYNGPGVPGYGSGTFWNTVYGPNFVTANNVYTSLSGIADDGSTDTHISWTMMPATVYSWPDASGIALLGSPGSAYGNTPQSFSFTLPSGRYNVVLFSAAGAASSNGGSPNTAAAFTINGVTQNALSSTDTSFVQGNNFVVFTNVNVSGTSLNGTWTQVNGYPNFGSLNGAQLQYVGPAAPTLGIQAIGGGQLQLQWSAGILLEATNVAGPWTTNGAASPLTVTPSPTTPQKFYRVKLP